MPFYNLRCTKCGHEFEDYASVNGPNPTCPKPVGEHPPEHDGATGFFIACGGDTVRFPAPLLRVDGGLTPKFFPGRH